MVGVMIRFILWKIGFVMCVDGKISKLIVLVSVFYRRKFIVDRMGFFGVLIVLVRFWKFNLKRNLKMSWSNIFLRIWRMNLSKNFMKIVFFVDEGCLFVLGYGVWMLRWL